MSRHPWAKLSEKEHRKRQRIVIALVSSICGLVVIVFVFQLLSVAKSSGDIDEDGLVNSTRETFMNAYRDADSHNEDFNNALDVLSEQIEKEKDALDAQEEVLDKLGELIKTKPEEANAAGSELEDEEELDAETLPVAESIEGAEEISQ